MAPTETLEAWTSRNETNGADPGPAGPGAAAVRAAPDPGTLRTVGVAASRRKEPSRFLDFRPKRDLVTRRLWRDRSRRFLRVAALGCTDAAAAALTLGVGFGLAGTAGPEAWLPQLPLSAALAVLTQAALGNYGPGEARRQYGRAFVGGILTVGLLLALGASLSFPFPGAVPAAAMGVSMGGLACLARWTGDGVVRWAHGHGLGTRRTLVVGDDLELRKIASHVRAGGDRRIRVLGRVEPEWAAVVDDALGALDDLSEIIETHDVRSVIISARLSPEEFREIARKCLLHGCTVSVVPATLSELPVQISSYELLGWPLLELEMPRLHLFQVVLKRGVDLALGSVGLLLASPLLAGLAVAIKLDSPGPVLFRQRRLGVAGRPFTIYKFRSMRADAEKVLRSRPALHREYLANDFKLPPERDPRITRLGSFLRRSSLDELPQLLNVLKGDMSLVGPRPIVPDEIENYGEEAPVFLGVKPGVTGQWQVNGRSSVGYPERAELDINYIESWSLGRDLLILARTVPIVLGKKGAH